MGFPPWNFTTFAAVFAAAMAYFAVTFLRTGKKTVKEAKDQETRWVEGRARVLDVKIVREPRGDGSYTSRSAYAVVRTADGREVTGWTGDVMSGFSRSSIGREFQAWYDPEDPGRFRLTRPSAGCESLVLACVVVAFLGAAVFFAVLGLRSAM
jgi:hypothetical protein